MARAFFAALIALSVATLPVTGAVALSQKSAEQIVAVSNPASPGHDCCADASEPCGISMDGCPFMAVCALQGLTFSGTGFFLLVWPAIPQGNTPPPAGNVLVSQTHSPPLHPPQV